MPHRVILTPLVMVLALLLVAGCGQANVVGIQVPAHIGLDAETLQRIDEVNRTIKNGFEVGPKTRKEIEDVNATLAKGIELGPETRQTIERLLADIEAGLEIGLDYETRQTIEKLIATLGAAPGDWGDTLQQIIHTLEGSSSKFADNVAGKVVNLLDQAKGDLEEVGALTGAEFRCNVQFLHAEGMNTVNDFIGLDLVDRLNVIIFGRQIPFHKGDPAVCQVLPLQVDLKKVGEEYRSTKNVIVITGYNFAPNNRPEVYLSQGDNRLKSIEVLISTPYVIQLNLQPLKDDLATAPVGLKIVSVWLNGAVASEIPIILPEEVAPEPQAIFSARAKIYKGPGTQYNEVWQGDVSQSFKVIGRNSDRTWWQIEYSDKNGNLQKGWISAGDVAVSHVENAPVASAPNPPTASFEVVPVQGDPFSIQLNNHSVGEHPEFAWNFGDSSNPSADETPPVHRFGQAGSYTVTLKVTDDWGWDEASQLVSIVVQEPVTAQFDTNQPIGATQFTVAFNNNSTGPITRVQWEFGDGSTSSEWTPAPHTYAGPGPYSVKLTVWDDNASTSNVVSKSITLEPYFNGAVFFKRYGTPPLEGDVNLNTGIDSNQYHCGIVGLEVSGDIKEDGSGDIVKAYLQEEGATWRIIAGFRNENPNAQRWSIEVMCLDQRVSSRFTSWSYGWAGRDRYPGPAPDIADTTMSTSEYLCGIVGFAASDGDIDESGYFATVFEVMPSRWGRETWGITADIASHEPHERWERLDVLCVVNDPELFAFAEFQIPGGSDNQRIERSDGAPYLRDQWICGLVGMGVYGGDIQEKITGKILTGYLQAANQDWFASVNFLTEGGARERRGAALCVGTAIAEER